MQQVRQVAAACRRLVSKRVFQLARTRLVAWARMARERALVASILAVSAAAARRGKHAALASVADLLVAGVFQRWRSSRSTWPLPPAAVTLDHFSVAASTSCDRDKAGKLRQMPLVDAGAAAAPVTDIVPKISPTLSAGYTGKRLSGRQRGAGGGGSGGSRRDIVPRAASLPDYLDIVGGIAVSKHSLKHGARAWLGKQRPKTLTSASLPLREREPWQAAALREARAGIACSQPSRLGSMQRRWGLGYRPAAAATRPALQDKSCPAAVWARQTCAPVHATLLRWSSSVQAGEGLGRDVAAREFSDACRLARLRAPADVKLSDGALDCLNQGPMTEMLIRFWFRRRGLGHVGASSG